MGAVAHAVLDVTGGLWRRAAPDQAGIISGANPSAWNPSDPIRLWVIQLIVILGFCQILSLLFSRIRQPRVIAEVIAGVLLGPTCMGRIPNFTKTIFPALGMPLLALTANIGLVLFLFLVGLEVDLSLVRKNARSSASISIAGLILPLGMGAALGVPLYHQFVDDSVNFGYFLLFTAVAIGITAFPVLCRILTQLKLLDTTVGVVVLSAGVGNDVVGWILLALTVALVNAGSGIVALWVFLTGLAYTLFMLFPVKWAYRWLARYTGSYDSGNPTTAMMTVTLIMVFISAFFTDVIGIHAIFGGFLAGLVIPHENGYAISVVEKLEDLVSIIFLPLYFTQSGLNTNLGLLNDGITWGYTILIIVFAFVSKFVACGITAKYVGFNLRESGAIGALMSCKGLVELIVLNVGLSAGILDVRLFSMFVVHAIILTFMTTPLVLLMYPERLRTRVHSSVTRAREAGDEEGASHRAGAADDERKTAFTVVLDKMEQLPAAMTLTQLLQNPDASAATSTASFSGDDEKSNLGADLPVVPHKGAPQAQITLDALRLIELTGRTSAVLRSQEAEAVLRTDAVVAVFRTFAHLHRVAVGAALAIVAQDEFAVTVADHARSSGAQMVVVPWAVPAGEEDSKIEGTSAGAPAGLVAPVFPNFVRTIFASAPVDVALFVDRGVPLSGGHFGQHIVVPFFGGPDDRLALSFVVQLCANAGVTATVVRITKVEEHPLTPQDTIGQEKELAHETAHQTAFPDTVYGLPDTQTRLQSDTADDLLWSRYTASDGTHAPAVARALGRVTFSTQSTATPLRAVLDAAKAAQGRGVGVIVLAGRSRRMAVESHKTELAALVKDARLVIAAEAARTLGDVAAVVVAGTTTSVLVVQAARGTA